MYLLYSFLFSVGALFAAPYYLWRHRGEFEDRAWRERLGFLRLNGRSLPAGGIWIHAVSVGEALSAVPLVQRLSCTYPGRPILMSHVTPAGRKVGEQRLPRVAARFYMPLDWARATRRTLRLVQPSVLIIIETEIWPNLLRVAQENGCRVAIVNARVSDRSFPRYLSIRPFMKRVLSSVGCFCAQSETDAERLRQLGAPPERIVVTGNLKFDVPPPAASPWANQLKDALVRLGRRPVWVAASTMPGEEDFLLDAARKIRERYPRSLWILAPRHPSRFEQVAKLLAGSGIKSARRTLLGPGTDEVARQIESADTLLLDTIGELPGCLNLADVVLMGGTILPTGGHNLIEPAFAGKAILLGPHMENFRDVATRFLEARAALQVSKAEAVEPALLHLLEHPEERLELGKRARGVLETQRGAADRTLAQLKTWLEPPPNARGTAGSRG
jgi:3-deoxy-D-manno-octulosonic-acid transferase